MTDFANEPLWEEDTQEPEVVKQPPTDQPDLMAGAGNGAAARAAEQVAQAKAKTVAAARLKVEGQSPLTSDVPDNSAPAKQVQTVTKDATAEQSKPDMEAAIEPPKPKSETPETDKEIDWQSHLSDVLQGMHKGQLDKTLPAFLEVATHIPHANAAMVAGMIVSSYLLLPMGARNAVYDVLMAELALHPGLHLGQLIRVRMGGRTAPPDAAPPPAPAGDA